MGLYPNPDKAESKGLSREIVCFLSERGVESLFPVGFLDAYGLKGKAQESPVADWEGKVDFAIVLGGDGTLLGASRLFAPLGIPILGINLGHFGFLTELEEDNLFEGLPTFLEGSCEKDARTVLKAEVIRDGKAIFETLSMNEAGVLKGPYGRMTTLALKVRQKPVDTYFADGVIVSTPTGSTAYSLSAGGPVVAPDLDAFLVTPICPHTFYSRSIVFPSNEPCEVEVLESSQSTMLVVDGQEFFPLQTGDFVRCSNLGRKVVFLRRGGWSFYDVLRRKMKEVPGQPASRFPKM